jgi:hypothetical protein
MEIAVEKLAVICFFLIGISHIVQPRAWAEFFIRLRGERDDRQFHQCVDPFPAWGAHCSVSQCVARHSRNSNGAGVCVGIKRFYLFRFPRHGLKVMERVRLERAWEFVVAGILIVAVGGLLLFSLVSRGELS